jgi:hypothetical protein
MPAIVPVGGREMIPESLLESWSHQGAVTTSSATRASIYNALQGSDSALRDKDIDVYLQGSWGNDTNTRGSSDVDVVAQLNSTYFYDVEELSPSDKHAFDRGLSRASYQFADYRADVTRVLRAYYGESAITSGNKSIKVAPAPGQRLPADVVPCCIFKKFYRFPVLREGDVVEGIKFFAANDGRGIVNYPKLHRDNGSAKNSATQTNGFYKPTVRVMKNARRKLVEDGVLTKDVAPSYFVECLVYNVPNKLFGPTLQATMYNVLKWAKEEANLDKLVCQNERVCLFGATPEQWSKANAEQLVAGLVRLWNDWNE